MKIGDEKMKKESKSKGTKTKFYQYESSTSSNVTIPKSIAGSLGWTHKDELRILVKEIDGNVGIFIYKENE